MECSLAASLSVCGSGPEACFRADLNGRVGLPRAADEQFLQRCTRAQINALVVNHAIAQSGLASRIVQKKVLWEQISLQTVLALTWSTTQLAGMWVAGSECRGAPACSLYTSCWGLLVRVTRVEMERLFSHILTWKWSKSKNWSIYKPPSLPMKWIEKPLDICQLASLMIAAPTQWHSELHMKSINQARLALMRIRTCYYYKSSSHHS